MAAASEKGVHIIDSLIAGMGLQEQGRVLDRPLPCTSPAQHTQFVSPIAALDGHDVAETAHANETGPGEWSPQEAATSCNCACG